MSFSSLCTQYSRSVSIFFVVVVDFDQIYDNSEYCWFFLRLEFLLKTASGFDLANKIEIFRICVDFSYSFVGLISQIKCVEGKIFCD